MSSPSEEILDRLKFRLVSMNSARNVQQDMGVIDHLLNVESLDELKHLTDDNQWLCSQEVINALSELRANAAATGDDYVVNNLSITITALSFLYEGRLRSQAVVPSSLASQVDVWNSKKPALDMTQEERRDAIVLSRSIISAADFDKISPILRRDILRWVGEALLETYNSTHSPEDLNDSAHFLSEATELCPETSIDFVRCMTYGGLAMLLKSRMPASTTDLDTAIIILQHAVAACAYNPQELLAQAGTGLARALLTRFAGDGRLEDLQSGADMITYTIAELNRRGEPLSPDTIPIASAILSDLQSHPNEAARRQSLVDALEDTLHQ
jgi:hypothetical protein